MTFTLVSHLREQLSVLVKTRTEKRQREEREKERLAIEVYFYPSATPAYATITVFLGRGSSNARNPRHTRVIFGLEDKF
jgi:hypothetical protein